MSTPSPIDLPAKPIEPALVLRRIWDGRRSRNRILSTEPRPCRIGLVRSPWVLGMPHRQLRFCQLRESPRVSSADDHRTTAKPVCCGGSASLLFSDPHGALHCTVPFWLAALPLGLQIHHLTSLLIQSGVEIHRQHWVAPCTTVADRRH
jgi:hypothetical protein